MSSDCLIDARNLQKHFNKKQVICDVSLRLMRNEVLGFLGPNGAGKTTTMRMLAGYLAPDQPQAGQIVIDGHDLYKHPLQAKASLGYLPEGTPAWNDLKVCEFLQFFCNAHGLDRQQAKKRQAEMRDQFHLYSCWYQPLETLSKGFRRRVGFAAALIHDPDILILDEPTDGLDPNQKHEMRGLIRNLSSGADIGRGRAILISTHILEEVEALCDRVLILSEGKIVADGTAEEIVNQAETPVTHTLSQRLEQAFRTLTQPRNEEQVTP